jgi:hypothetical protein
MYPDGFERYDVDWEICSLEYEHRNVDNDPGEPYRAIATVFNADLFAQGVPDREAWLVISKYVLEKLPEVELRRLRLD